jgi:hypothetical protein
VPICAIAVKIVTYTFRIPPFLSTTTDDDWFLKGTPVVLDWLRLAYRSSLNLILKTDTHEWAIIGVVIVVIGAVCMRGFGSRTKY